LGGKVVIFGILIGLLNGETENPGIWLRDPDRIGAMAPPVDGAISPGLIPLLTIVDIF
jgi:hypothetical protein